MKKKLHTRLNMVHDKLVIFLVPRSTIRFYTETEPLYSVSLISIVCNIVI